VAIKFIYSEKATKMLRNYTLWNLTAAEDGQFKKKLPYAINSKYEITVSWISCAQAQGRFFLPVKFFNYYNDF
jgi:hypothetical protein